MNARKGTLLIVAAILLLVTGQCIATTWNLADDITPTTTTNPVGAWSMGYVTALGGSFTIYNHCYALTGDTGKKFNAFDYAPDPDGGWRGFVVKNTTNVAETVYGLPVPAYGIGFHPGWADTNTSIQTFTVIRWTSPVSGAVKINATFTGRPTATSGVYVYQKGTTERFSGMCNGTTPQVTPDIYTAVAPGDTIDFLCGWGNGWYTNDFTAIAATIVDGIATGTLSGKVSSEFPGNPGIAGATVNISDGSTVVPATANADGNYTIDLLPGTYSVEASAPGRVTSAAVEVTIAANGTVTQNFALAGGAIEGTVTASYGGPVEGVTVTAGDYTVLTDASGHYSIICVPGPYSMTASKTGHETGTADITVTSGAVTTQDFVLLAGIIRGQATASGSGNPILGAKVIVGDYFEVTEADGNYSILMPPGDYTAVCRAGGYVSASQSVTVSTTSTLTQNFALPVNTAVDFTSDFNTYANPSGAWSLGQELTLGGTFTLMAGWNTMGTDDGLVGTALDAQVISNPTATDDHWMVGDYYVADFEAGKTILLPGYAGEKAVARFTMLAPGRYLINATFKGRYGSGTGTTSNVHLLKNNALTVSGMVRGFSGTAAVGYGDAFGDSALTTLGGVFDLAVNDTVEFAVDTGGDGYATDETQLDGTIALYSGAYGTLQGRVTNCVGSEGIAGAKVKALGYADWTYYGAVTDANGDYTLMLPEGYYDIEISKTGYMYSAYDAATISSGQTTTVDACLTGTAIVGHVRYGSASGPGIAGVTVRTDDDAYTTVTDEDGAYEIPLYADTYTLIAEKAGYGSQQQGPITVPDGERVTVDFVLEPGVYDVAADFDPSLAANPSGVWSYGKKATPTGNFIIIDMPFAYGNGLVEWCHYIDAYITAKCVFNTATEPFDWVLYNINANVEPERFYMGPGSDEMAAVARWTAPAAGWVQVDAAFSGRDFVSGTTSNVHVVRDSTSFFDGALSGFSGSTLPEPARAAFGTAPTQTYSGIIDVESGSTIDFMVGTGPDGWETDIAELQATLYYTAQPLVECATIDEAKTLADGTPVAVTQAKVVTVAADTYVDGARYVEEPGRTGGIKVIFTSGAAALGDAITFSGTVRTDSNNEKYIEITSVDSTTAASVLEALGMTNKTAVGGQVQGLLVTVWGTIVSKDASQITIDDGSGIGLRVQLSGLTSSITKTLTLNKTVSITGPMGLFNGAANVRPRGNDDVVLNN